MGVRKILINVHNYKNKDAGLNTLRTNTGPPSEHPVPAGGVGAPQPSAPARQGRVAPAGPQG